jgi:methyl-accepting chemotaxis protein
MSASDLDRVRLRYDEALMETYRFYEDLEEMAAYLTLEQDRLDLELADREHSNDDLKARLEENNRQLSETTAQMHLLLDRIKALLHEKRQSTADVLASRQILNLSDHMGDFLDWSEEVSSDIRSRVEALKSEAKISSEISGIRINSRKSKEA